MDLKEDFDDLILSLAWDSINARDWKNPIFQTIFPSFDHLADLYQDIKIIYTEKLLQISQKSSPPNASWFLSLPPRLPTPKDWGIYALVLCKGSKYRIYIGSGTSVKGCRARLLQHRGRHVEPRWVRLAKDQGYKQVHAALLAQCEQPPAAKIPVFRTALIALEAAFHVLLWPMVKKDLSYGFPAGLWSPSDFTYGGLCGHNPLVEGVITGLDDIKLTAEQLEHKAAVSLARKRERQRIREANLRASRCPKYLAHRLRMSRAHQPKYSARDRLRILQKKFYCTACDRAVRNN